MADHAEVHVKVNARVDEGIAPLVSALSEIDGLETVESCQGGDGRMAFVILRFGDWRTCGAFLFDDLLSAMDANLRSDASFELIGYEPSNCLGRISLTPEAVGAFVETITHVRRCAYSGDKPRTSQPDC